MELLEKINTQSHVGFCSDLEVFTRSTKGSSEFIFQTFTLGADIHCFVGTQSSVVLLHIYTETRQESSAWGKLSKKMAIMV